MTKLLGSLLMSGKDERTGFVHLGKKKINGHFTMLQHGKCVYKDGNLFFWRCHMGKVMGTSSSWGDWDWT